MVNLSESVQTMYPMLNSSFDEIKTAVINNGSTDNITYNAGSKYTATMLLSAIDSALAKARMMKKIVQCAKYIHVNPSIWNPPLSGGSSALV